MAFVRSLVAREEPPPNAAAHKRRAPNTAVADREPAMKVDGGADRG